MRVLIITRFFAPMARARAIQMVKVTDALHAAGCEVCVVAGCERDAGKLPAYPYRVEYVLAHATTNMWKTSGAWRRSRGRIANLCVRARWIRDAGRVATRLLDEFRPDVCMTASEPYDSHSVGLIVRRRTAIPWITYFSDPTPFAALPPPYNRQTNPVMNWIEMRAVRRPLRLSDALVMTNRHGVRRMETAFRLALTSKSTCIPHIGTPPPRPLPCRNARLTHIGDLYRRLSVPLLEAVKRAAEDIPGFPGLLFVGRIPEELPGLIRRVGVERVVELREPMPHAAAQELAAASQVLLVIEAAMPESPFLPSKFADYAMTGRPILAITPQVSAIRDYVCRYGGGLAVRADADEIHAALHTLYATRPGNEQAAAGGQPGELASVFHAPNVVARYLELFNRVRAEGRRGTRP